MQRTRLNTLFEAASRQLSRWLFNPWRRLSVVLISLLGGNFFGVAIASVSGQAAEQDVVVAAMLVAAAELISRFVYSRRRPAPDIPVPLGYDAVNAFKVGVMYALFVEAFKLGS
jgi:Protein of unknown function (DUF565)